MLKKGFSLIEMLVAISLFVIIATVAAQSLGSGLRSSKKTESIGDVRENVNYAMSTMERLLRNARGCTATGSSNQLNYTDEFGRNVYFSCTTLGTTNFIASNAATLRLTSPNVIWITNCPAVFNCTDGVSGLPDSIDISITARHASVTAAEGATVTSTTRVLLRNYKGI